MSYKPDETALIAYLYDELDGKDKEMVQDYLREHPEEVKKLQEMKAVLAIMSSIGDKEVIVPTVAGHESISESPFWKSSGFRTVVSIAAGFLILLIAGRLIGPEIRFGNGELRISFGDHKAEPVNVPVTPVLTEAEVRSMINSSMLASSQSQEQRWSENQQKLNASIHQSLDLNSRKVDDLIKNTSQASSEQLRSYVGSLQAENLRLIKDYFQLSAKEQNQYVENLMVGFSKYVQEQRTEDMLLVQHKMQDLEKNSDQFKQETEQLLASIISSTPAKKSY